MGRYPAWVTQKGFGLNCTLIVQVFILELEICNIKKFIPQGGICISGGPKKDRIYLKTG